MKQDLTNGEQDSGSGDQLFTPNAITVASHGSDADAAHSLDSSSRI
jgi:hypothetical protein